LITPFFFIADCSIFIPLKLGMNLSKLINNIPERFRNKYFVVSFLFVAWIFFFDEDNITDHIQNKRKLGELLIQKKYYKEQIVSDRQKLEDLNMGVNELEKFAREQYFMSMPDEEVFVVDEN